MNEDYKLTPDEAKAIRNLVIWLAVKIGVYCLIQVAIRRYLEKTYGTTDPQTIQARIIKDNKTVPAEYNRITRKFVES